MTGIATLAGDASPFAFAAPTAIAAGLHVVAIRPGEKAPGTYMHGRWANAVGWQHYATAPAPEKVIANWSRAPGAGIGAVLGSPAGDGLFLTAVDIDEDDPARVAIVRAAIPDSQVVKTGGKGETLLFRSPPEIVSASYNIGSSRAVDLLAKGRQTVLPPSVHPSGVEYRYIGGGLVPVETLPVFGLAEKERLEEALRGLGWQPATSTDTDQGEGVQTPPQAPGERGADGDYFREVNETALTRLDSWVPALNLVNVRTKAGGYEATASWRPSNTPGKLLEQRKRNLSFTPKGITDFGDGPKGYTAIDVVVAAFSWDFDSAFQWLRGKLGLKGEDDDFFALPEPPRRIIAHDDGALFDAETGEIIGGANDNSAPCSDDAFPDHLTRPAGTLGEMVDYVVATAPKPSRALALAACLVALGSLCARRDETPTTSGTALYVIALAATGVGKQHPQDAGEALVRAATMDRGDDIMGPSDLMSEGALITEIKYRPHSCSFIDEFGDLVAKINGFNAKSFETGIKKILLQIWGKPYAPWKTPSYAKIRGVPIHSPAFSLFGASTPNKFYEAMSGEDRENGFLNRFLIIPETAKVKSVDPEFDWRQVPPELAEKLRAIYEIDRDLLDTFDAEGKPLNDPWNASVEPRRRHVGWASDEAKAVYDHFRAECDDAGHFFARSAEMAGRIATIVAIGRDWETPAVSIDDIRYGIELTRWSAEHMARQAADHVTSGAAGAERSKILRKVQQSGGRVAQSEVMKHLGYTAKALEEHVRDMGPDGTGQLVVEAVAPAGGGKPKRYLRLADR